MQQSFSAVDHEKFMKSALAEANKAFQDREVPIGCVIVKDNKIIASGANETNQTCNATRHAELVALDKLLPYHGIEFFKKCELYVTVEPCIMCASALKQCGLTNVYFGCYNDRFGGCGSVLSLHEERGKKMNCVSGILKNEAIEILQKFYERGNPNTETDSSSPKAKRLKV